jgi:hypothetical protein
MSDQDCPHPIGYLGRPPGALGRGRFRHQCGLCGAILTSREVGLNPRALGTNLRAWRERHAMPRRRRRRVKRLA